MITILLARLPGGRGIKAAALVVLICAVIAVCFEWAFPWLSALGSGGEVVSEAVAGM